MLHSLEPIANSMKLINRAYIFLSLLSNTRPKRKKKHPEMIQPLKNVWMTNIFILIGVHLVITNVPTRMFPLCIDGNQKPSSGQILTIEWSKTLKWFQNFIPS